jgi:Zn-dependent protease with chaperone function
MNEITGAALRSLPWWAGWMSVFIYTPAALLLAILASRAGLAIAIGPLRRFDRSHKERAHEAPEAIAEASAQPARIAEASAPAPPDTTIASPAIVSADFAERARLAYPARVFTGLCALFVPGLLAGASVVVHKGSLSIVPPLTMAAIAFAVAFIPALRARLFTEREVRRTSIPVGRWLTGGVTMWLFMMPHFLVAVVVSIAMPVALDEASFAWLLGGAVVIVVLIMGGTVTMLRVLRLARPASPRLAKIVHGAAAKARIRPRATYELVLPWANAFALPMSGCLAFTDEAIAALRDDELAAVCAHELGHLSEGARTLAVRLVTIFAIYVPIALAKPLLAGGSPGPFAIAMLGSYAVLIFARRLFRRMEVRADKAAHTHQGDEGTYARALARLTEVNAMPVVIRNQAGVHPDLYDRLLAAGVTPAYARPQMPSRLRALAAIGAAIAIPFGGLIALRSGLSAAKSALAGTGGAAEIAVLSVIGDADAIGHLALSCERRGDMEGAAALYAVASEATDIEPFYAAKQGMALASAGRCEQAEAAVVAAEEMHLVFEREGDASLVAAARLAVSDCFARLDENVDE